MCPLAFWLGVAAQADDGKTTPSGSWFGKLWGGKKEPTPPATPGAPGAPIKAKLGEESAFYYDKDLKKWVNKKVRNSVALCTPFHLAPQC